MRIDCALLCDAATVREGLLHILGGGITRVQRPSYPAPLGMTLAMRILVHPTEFDRAHQLEVQLQGEDGQRVAGLDATFQAGNSGDLAPGEEASLALPLAFPEVVQLPSPGRYSFELLIDGIHQATVPFLAAQVALQQLAGPPQGG